MENKKNLEDVDTWVSKWKVQLNVDKCKIICLGATTQNKEYVLNGIVMLHTNQEEGFRGYCRKILKAISQVCDCNKLRIVCIWLNFGNHFKERVCLHLKILHCRVMWMIPGFKNICFDKRLKKQFILNSEMQALMGLSRSLKNCRKG